MDPFSLILASGLVFPEDKPKYIRPDPPVIQAAPPPVVHPPVIFRATDAYGQAWTHPDRVFLDQWIIRRNQSIIRTAIPPVYYGSRCNGRCR
jgi:hypothetical protein